MNCYIVPKISDPKTTLEVGFEDVTNRDGDCVSVFKINNKIHSNSFRLPTQHGSSDRVDSDRRFLSNFDLDWEHAVADKNKTITPKATPSDLANVLRDVVFASGAVSGLPGLDECRARLRKSEQTLTQMIYSEL